MEPFVSEAIALPSGAASGNYRRADLVFYDVEHRGNSYSARVFLDPAGGQPDTSPDREDGLAGRFVIFGHGGCVGDPGHCELSEHRDVFDSGPPQGLRPQTKTVEITTALKSLNADSVTITVIAVRPSPDGVVLAENCRFTGMRLLTYELSAS